jgi:hypothetical protein
MPLAPTLGMAQAMNQYISMRLQAASEMGSSAGT